MQLTAGQDGQAMARRAEVCPSDEEAEGSGGKGGTSSGGSSRTGSEGSGEEYAGPEDNGAELHSGVEERLTGGSGRGPQIREVWRDNLLQEFQAIARLVRDFPFVALDTEFPGVVTYLTGTDGWDTEEFGYQQVKCNVDLLKLIQLGITLFDSSGRMPEGVCTWQFNFQFDLETDMYAQESIDLLQSSGLEFQEHQRQGIDSHDFAELMLSSGLVLDSRITWLTFHSAYDFSYLLRQLTQTMLPISEAEFQSNIKLYFPVLYDIKYLMLFTDGLVGGLQNVANYLAVERIGTQHQAGSDSLLTGQVFFRMYQQHFPDGLSDVKYSGHIAGFKSSLPSSALSLQAKKDLEDAALCAELEELQTGMSSPMRDH